MAKFDSYFLMNLDDAKEYALAKVTKFDWDQASMQCKEIGDGNLNYVFRVWDAKGNSAIIKQAGESLRISADMHISTDRNRIESEILLLQGKLAPGYVPEIYFYDTVMCACGMQDLSDHAIMRTSMLQHKIYPKFADQISTYMANTLMGTTDVVLDHKEKKDLQKKYINPELCEITEDLVYTEPYNDCAGRNNVFAPNAEFVRKELYEDTALQCEVAKLKMDFMCNAQSLIHGDLHTGSIFINEDSTIVFDPEFCMYGPMGYDIGNVIANMIFKQLPTSTKLCTAALSQIPRAQEYAVRDLGGGRLSVLKDVILPGLRPAFFSSFSYNFSTAMTTAGAVIFLINPGKKLAVFKLFDAVSSGEYAIASLISTLIIIIVLVVEGIIYMFSMKGVKTNVS